MTVIVLIDFANDLGGTLNDVYRLEHDRNHKNKNKIMKIGPLVYELDLLLWKLYFDGHLGGHREFKKMLSGKLHLPAGFRFWSMLFPRIKREKNYIRQVNI